MLEALAAKNRAALSRLEGDGGFLTTLRANRRRDRSLRCALALVGLTPLGLATLATLGLVLKSLFRVEELLPGRENKFASAVNTLQRSISVFHNRSPRAKELLAAPANEMESLLVFEGPFLAGLPWLIALEPGLFPDTLAGQRFFHPPLFPWLEIVGVTFDFFDDVFLLDLALETAKRIFQRLAFLKPNFSQSISTSIP